MIAQTHLDQYDRDGFTVCERLIDPHDLAEFRIQVDRFLAVQSAGRRPERLDKPHLEDPKFLEVVSQAAILDSVERFIGPDIVVFSTHLICKAPRDGLAVPWHQDAHYWPLSPMEVVTVWLAVDDVTVENGCMRVIPGTHRLGPLEHVTDEDAANKVLHACIRPELVDEARAVNCEIPAGGASFHAPHLIHGSAANLSPHRRCGLTIRYMPTSTRLRRDGPMARWFADHPLFLVRGSDNANVNTYANT